MKVLIIEQDDNTVRDISFCLQVRYQDATILSVATGSKGIEVIEAETPDMVMIDYAIDDLNILDLIDEIRSFSDVPIVLLTQDESDLERAKALEKGADEYVVKPFSPIDLLARVHALLRRTMGIGFKKEGWRKIGKDIVIDFDSHEVIVAGKLVKLTPIEYNLLTELVRNEGRVIRHGTLLEKIWGPEFTGDPTFIKTYIYRLRSKLGCDSPDESMFRAERGVGYRFVRLA